MTIMASESGWNMPTGDLMKGKKGLIMGVANANSIAWGIASQLAAQGAELAFTYLGEGLERRVRPLAESVGAKLLIQADVTDDASMDSAFAELEREFGTLDFVVHSVAFANKDELKGSFVDNTSRDSFLLAMNISAFSFVDVAKRASKLMPNGGALVTMTYLGSERAIPNYNTMGVAKAALEAATRYIARDLGPRGIRVNAISAGAMRTLSLAGISGGRGMIAQGRAMSAMKEDTSMEGVAGCALWLCSDLGFSTTGEVIHVDAGFHMMGMGSEEEG
jgi:enoyl-[acyl-carrier protein] reductase I